MHRTLWHATLVVLALLLPSCSDSAGPSPEAPRLALAVGGQHACYASEGVTRCWGRGTSGQLGIGTTPDNATPSVMAGGLTFVQLVAGASHTCGLDAEGLAYCWGLNANGQLGTTAQLDECPLPCATTPRPVAGDLRFRTLAAGNRHTCGITTAGAAFCWGLNSLGQVGTAVVGESCIDGICFRVPTPVQGNRSFAAITGALNHTCALEVSGRAFCWGFQTGTSAGGNRIPQFRPEVIAMRGGVIFRQISAGGWHTCGVTAAGAAYCWGIDALGAGPSPLEADAPVAVKGGHEFDAVYSGGSTSCGLNEEGAAFCWGPNTDGAVGTEPIGSTIRFDLPTAVSGGLRFTALAPGQSTYCGITTTEDIVCWGRGSSGELGVDHEDSSSPVSIPGL